MKTVLIHVSRIGYLKIDGWEYQKIIISKKMGECFSILCALSFLCSKPLVLCYFSQFKIQVLQKSIDK